MKRLKIYLPAFFTVIFAFFSTGCETVKSRPRYGNVPISAEEVEKPKEIKDTQKYRQRIKNKTLRVVMFPVNLGPNIVSNTVCTLKPGNLWPLQYATWPFIGLPTGIIFGVGDAWHGYPFWEPTMIKAGY